MTGNYLQEHIKQLDKVAHSLDQITIGYPYNPDESKHNKLFMESIPSTTEHGVPIVVHKIPNISRSYSQWSYMFGVYRNRFTHYIFIEDDYVPVKAGFDKILVELYEESATRYNCGYLCGMMWDESGRFGTRMTKHAAVSNGISSCSVLEKVWRKNGCLPHDKTKYESGQVLFSRGFLEANFDIKDYIDHYRCLYWQHSNVVRWYWDGQHNEDLIIPIQCLKKGWTLQEIRTDIGIVKPVRSVEQEPPPAPTNRRTPQTPPPVNPALDRFKRSFQLGVKPGRPRHRPGR